MLRIHVLALGLLLSSSPVRAQDGDGLYGRFGADVVVSAATLAGPAWDDSARPLATLELRARYLDTAGVLVAPEWRGSFGGRTVLAIELRPLFPGRLLMDRFSGVRTLDLFIDSFAVDLGAMVGPFGRGPGASFLFGLGIDVPIRYRHGRGVFLHVGARMIRGRARDLAGPAEALSEWNILLGLGVRTTIDAGVARREPPRFRPRRP